MKKFLLAFILFASQASAQDRYTFEILAPNTNLPSNHVMTRCYTGVTCTFPVLAVGGEWPYDYTLTNAPSGMVVKNADAGETCGIGTATHTHVLCGEITWTNPSAGSYNPTIQVCDVDNDCVSTDWDIAAQTTGFRFVDDVNGSDTGGSSTGLIASPWRTVGYAKANMTAGDFIYFRTGTYTVNTEFGTAVNPGGSRYQVEFTNPVWIEYPGDTVIIDQAADDLDDTFFPTLGFTGYAFTQGFEITNCKYFCVLHGSTPSVLGSLHHRIKVHHQGYGTTEAGSNASMFMWEHSDPQGIGATIIESELYDAGLGFKHYDLLKPIIAHNLMYSMDGGVEHKAGATQYTDRANHMYDIGTSGGLYDSGIDGNQNDNSFAVTGEIYYNRIKMNIDAGNVDEALMVGWEQGGGFVDIWRNTLEGKTTAYNVDSTMGPYYFTRNVVVNDDAVADHITYDTVTDTSRIIKSENVSADIATGIIDANGLLTGATRTTYCNTVCTRGHELNGEQAGGGAVPLSPRRLMIK